jgi:hypothetical protein
MKDDRIAPIVLRQAVREGAEPPHEGIRVVVNSEKRVPCCHGLV